MRATRGLSALSLAFLLCMAPSLAHADDAATDSPTATPATPGADDATEPVPTETTPTEDTPTEDVPTEDAPSDDAPTEDVPTEDTPAEDAEPFTDGLTAKFAAAALALARPVANDDVFSVKTNTGAFPTNLGLIRIGANGVFKNDVPTEGGDQTPNIITLIDSVDHGTVDLNGDGGFTYIPAIGYAGIDQFIYRYSTDEGESDDAIVTITVGAGTPIATNDAYVTAPDTQLVVTPPGVFANDSDVALFGFSVINGVDEGTLTQPGLFSAGRFTYTPDPGFVGIDTFTYRFSTLLGGPSNVATVTIIVGEPGVAVDDAYEVRAEESLNIPAATGVSANDSITNGTVELVAEDGFGTLVLNPDGSFTYDAPNGFVGPVHFDYRFTDPVTTLQSNVATVTITILPNAQDDAYTTPAGELLTVPALGIRFNDTHPVGGIITIHDAVDHGVLALGAGDDGSFTYLPDPGFVGVDTFTYSFELDNGVSDIATVGITVTPVALDDEIELETCDDIEFNPLANDPNTDFLNSVPTIVDPPDNGQVMPAGGQDIGSLNYDPDAGFVGDDTFTYTYETDGLESNVATVTIHVTACDSGGGGDDDSLLPDTGSGLQWWTLLMASMSALAGVLLLRRGRTSKA